MPTKECVRHADDSERLGHSDDSRCCPHSLPPLQGTNSLEMHPPTNPHPRQELTSAETAPGTAATAAPRRMATVDSFMMIVDTMEEMFTDIKTRFYVLQARSMYNSAESIEVESFLPSSELSTRVRDSCPGLMSGTHQILLCRVWREMCNY